MDITLIQSAGESYYHILLSLSFCFLYLMLSHFLFWNGVTTVLKLRLQGFIIRTATLATLKLKMPISIFVQKVGVRYDLEHRHCNKNSVRDCDLHCGQNVYENLNQV